MKKYVWIVAALVFLFSPMQSMAADGLISTYTCSALTGGGFGSLDKIPNSELETNDRAMVIVLGGSAYHYVFDDTSSASESSPNVITPNDSGGNGRWILVSSSSGMNSGNEIAAGTNPTTTSSTAAIDTNSGGAIEMDSVLVATKIKTVFFSVDGVEGLSESKFPIFEFDASIFKHGITVTKLNISTKTLPTGAYRVMLEEWVVASTTTATAYVADCLSAELDFGTTNYGKTTSTFADAAIAAGNALVLDINDTDFAGESIGRLWGYVCFTINEGN